MGDLTPLIVGRRRVFLEAGDANQINLPPQENLCRSRSWEYCEYQKGHGHTTDECEALKYKIEKLIRAGHFETYVDIRGR